ncbi:response regulator [Yoonia sediminilitoris]|uniref:Response regulator receiver domain-containing protein n=1 Tax=Yoonia sediminilitoris TaxID=1286148 RepID=A0A2T6KR17_9RHOB|nr:response regulator [Yoonia sediminilitoris]PUB19008.1 response regulator receiver domain-containing protein [Yoonia sediminilitoris]RCW99176.1 response regulator receiver domain-containing protein [Yoonia sediminilitoris]
MAHAIEKFERPSLGRAIGKDLSAISVIVLDDNEFDQRQLGRALKSAGISGEVQCVADLDSFARLIKGQQFDFAFIDFNLADGTGLDAIQILREQPADLRVLPIMVAGEARMELAVQAMKDGCKDFLSKQDLSAERLRGAIFGAMRQKSRGADFDLRPGSVDNAMDNTAIAGLRPRIARMQRIVKQVVKTTEDEDRQILLQMLDDNCSEFTDYCNEIAKPAVPANTKLN